MACALALPKYYSATRSPSAGASVREETFMITQRRIPVVLLVLAASFLDGCAGLARRDPVQVMVAGIEPLQGQGLELRFAVKLRVQNPNDSAIDYNGVYVQMDVQGRTFASGVSDASGSVPRFGEAVISVPVTVSAFRMARQAIGLLNSDGSGKISYQLKGKLNGPAFNSVRFTSKGDLDLPAGAGPVGNPGT